MAFAWSNKNLKKIHHVFNQFLMDISERVSLHCEQLCIIIMKPVIVFLIIAISLVLAQCDQTIKNGVFHSFLILLQIFRTVPGR